jgi:hypothetical protein
MTDSRLTAVPLLLGDAPAAAISACAAAVTSAVQVGLVGAPNVDWRSVATAIGEKIKAMFDINLIELITGAWEDLRELRECADSRKHPADESISLPLIDHHIDATVRPYLDVAIGGLPAIRVGFEIAFDIELQGVTVEIQDAVIRGLRLGSCQAEATVKCQGAVLFERSMRKLEVPGEIVLTHGIPIRAPDSA